MSKIYILGAGGFMGGQCAEYFLRKGFEVITEKVDITDLAALQKEFSSSRPDVVINFAGVRAYPNIDWCEDHKEETLKVNLVGAINAMTAALECGAYPIQISSGCVYSGGPEHAFTEEDRPNFYGSFYSRMRVVLQDALAELPVLVARIRMPISHFSHPRNIINKVTSFSRVISVPNSMTLLEDLWPALERIVEVKPIGILNLANEGYVRHEDILTMYQEIVNPAHAYELISTQELEDNITKAKRSNCILSMQKAKSLGIDMPAIDGMSLRDIMVSFKKSLSRKTV